LQIFKTLLSEFETQQLKIQSLNTSALKVEPLVDYNIVKKIQNAKKKLVDKLNTFFSRQFKKFIKNYAPNIVGKKYVAFVCQLKKPLFVLLKQCYPLKRNPLPIKYTYANVS